MAAIEATRLRVEGAAAKIKAARADFYPTINLNAGIGHEALGLSYLTKTNALTEV